MAKIIKQAKINDNPLIVGDEQLKKFLAACSIDTSKTLNLKEIEDHIAGIIATAEQNAQAMGRQGYDQGFKKGFDDARAQGQKIVEEAQKVRADALKERDALMAALEPKLLEMVVKVAEKVIRKEVEDKETIVHMIRETLNQVVNRENLKIKVNPSDVELINLKREEILRASGTDGSMVIEADPGISSGSCIIETVYGTVDARIESQLSDIYKALKAAHQAIMNQEDIHM